MSLSEAGRRGLTLLVLAAGMGSRFGGLKQFEPVGPMGQTLLDYSVFDALRAGFGRLVFVVREDFANAFEAGVARRYRAQLRVDWVCQRLDDLPDGLAPPPGRSKPWGTTHAVLAARDVIDEPFAVINADDFYGRQAYCQVARFFAAANTRSPGRDPHDALDHCCMVGYALTQTLSDSGGVNRGLCLDDGGLLTSVQELRDIVADHHGHCTGIDLRGQRVSVARDAVASMNFWGFPPTVFEPMQRHFAEFLRRHGDEPAAECYIPSVVDALICAQRADCTILRTPDRWFGMTYPQDKLECVRRLRELADDGTYPSLPWP